MTSFRIPVAGFTAALVLLAAAAPVAADVPARKSGTVKLELTGAKKASGTFPAICGPYFVMDAPGIAKAGDGLVFEVDIKDVGHFQLSSSKRTPGAPPTRGSSSTRATTPGPTPETPGVRTRSCSGRSSTRRASGPR